MNPFDEAQMAATRTGCDITYVQINTHNTTEEQKTNRSSDDGPCSRSTSFQKNFHFSEDLQLEVDIFQYFDLTLSRNTGDATYLPQDLCVLYPDLGICKRRVASAAGCFCSLFLQVLFELEMIFSGHRRNSLIQTSIRSFSVTDLAKPRDSIFDRHH